MPMAVLLPRNDRTVREYGAYRSGLQVLSRKETAVQRQLRRGGLASYEPLTQATLLSLVQVARRPTTFLDIGAHIGLYSAMIKAIFPTPEVSVIAFEPTPHTAGLARDLRRANALDFTIEELALSSEPGTASLFISAKAETSNSLMASFRPSHESVEVTVTTLDDYCHERGLSPSVIKIDVETFEAQVLEGGMATLSTARPAVVCELLPASERQTTDAVLERLADAGYSMFRGTEAGTWLHTPVSDYRQHLNGEFRDWLLVPEDLPAGFPEAVLDWLAAINDCTADTNLLFPGGKPPPRGWDRLYMSGATHL